MSLENAFPGLWALDRREQLRILSHPFLWPRDPRLASEATARGHAAPPPPPPGSAALISVSDTAERKTLWSIAHRPGERGGVPFGHAAEGARVLAERLVLRDLPVLADRRAVFPRVGWYVRPAHVEGLGADRNIEGQSFGASLLLAAASVALRRSVPTGVAASAALLADGNLAPVGRLAEKARLIERSGLGIDTFYVHSSQRALVETVLGESRRLVIRGVSSARELLAAVFPGFDAPAVLPEAWVELPRARAAADRLFAIALGRGSSLLAWRPLARLADLLVGRLGDDTAARRAAFARQVFARHAGEDAPLPPLHAAEGAALPEPLRVAMTAHVVQAAADSWEGVEAALELGSAELPAEIAACHADHLKLRGAMGRALAHSRRYGDAAEWLEVTVRAWLAVWLPGEASFALCELSRVRGLLGDAAGLARAEGFALALRDEPSTSLDSLGFLAVALGRAWVLCGDPARALGHLDAAELSTEVTRADVQATRHRWKARAFDLLRRAADAREERRALAAGWERDGGADPLGAVVLELDRALAGEGDWAQALEALRAARPALVRALGTGETGRNVAEQVAREYPY